MTLQLGGERRREMCHIEEVYASNGTGSV